LTTEHTENIEQNRRDFLGELGGFRG